MLYYKVWYEGCAIFFALLCGAEINHIVLTLLRCSLVRSFILWRVNNGHCLGIASSTQLQSHSHIRFIWICLYYGYPLLHQVFKKYILFAIRRYSIRTYLNTFYRNLLKKEHMYIFLPQINSLTQHNVSKRVFCLKWYHMVWLEGE